MTRIASALLIAGFLASLTGCEALKSTFKRKENAPPMISATNPSLEVITSAINRNSQMIRNLTTENASIYVPGVVIPLQSRLTFERPKRLRIQASASSLSGKELDFGSNDTLFWFWMRRLQGEMYYCRHDQFALCPVRSAVPIEPDWLIEALGMSEFKPNDKHSGPTLTSEGNWEIVSVCQTASGQFTKRTVVDAKVGWVVRQEVYSPQNELIASAAAVDLRYDRLTGIYYPKRVEVHCQGTDGKITIDLGSPKFNTMEPIPSATFDMPTFDGYRAVDLCSPDFLRNRGSVMPVSSAEPALRFSPAMTTPVAIQESTTSQAAIQTVVK
jgi:hypothetical protein